MSNKVRIVASYGEIKKLAIIDKNITLKENIYNLKKCFNIESLVFNAFLIDYLLNL